MHVSSAGEPVGSVHGYTDPRSPAHRSAGGPAPWPASSTPSADSGLRSQGRSGRAHASHAPGDTVGSSSVNRRDGVDRAQSMRMTCAPCRADRHTPLQAVARRSMSTVRTSRRGGTRAAAGARPEGGEDARVPRGQVGPTRLRAPEPGEGPGAARAPGPRPRADRAPSPATPWPPKPRFLGLGADRLPHFGQVAPRLSRESWRGAGADCVSPSADARSASRDGSVAVPGRPSGKRLAGGSQGAWRP